MKKKNLVAKHAKSTTSGAGPHKDRKKAMKNGENKHKKKFSTEGRFRNPDVDWDPDYDPGSDMDRKMPYKGPNAKRVRIRRDKQGNIKKEKYVPGEYITDYELKKRLKKSAKKQKSTNENNNGGEEYNDEAGMLKSNLHTMMRACKGLHNLVGSNENLPEWAQEKVAQAKGMLVAVWDYMVSQHEEGNVYTNEAFRDVDQKRIDRYKNMKRNQVGGDTTIKATPKKRSKDTKAHVKIAKSVDESTMRIANALMEDLQRFKKNT
jgi:hypothetical protein